MNSILLFLCGCLVVRASLAYAAYRYPIVLPWLGAAALVVGVSFFVLWAFGLRQTGFEVNNERVWWDSVRPMHGALYLAFAVLAFQRHPLAYVPLAIDVVLGLMLFLGFHYGGWFAEQR